MKEGNESNLNKESGVLKTYEEYRKNQPEGIVDNLTCNFCLSHDIKRPEKQGDPFYCQHCTRESDRARDSVTGEEIESPDAVVTTQSNAH